MINRIIKQNFLTKLIALAKQTFFLVCITSLLIGHTPFVSATTDYYDQLPDLGSKANTFLSEEKAKLLGKSFIRQSRYRMPYVSDPELMDYINRLGNRLLQVSTDAGKEYYFYLIDNNVINAFAVPGGHIALHTGILTKAESESELASVIAHEIAHITQSHISRGLENSKHDSWIVIGALLAAVAAGGADAAQAAIGVSQATILDRRLSYSRDFEAEADSLGIRLLSRAGMDPSAMPVFFKRLLDENRGSESSSLEFLRSHPLTVSRITESIQRVSNYPEAKPQNNREFLLMQAKAKALYAKDPVLSKRIFQKRISDGDNSLAARYGYAITLSRNGEFDAARNAFNKIMTDFPNSPDLLSVQLMSADNELEAKQIEAGLAILKKAYETEIQKGNHLVDIYYANALVLTNNGDTAIPIINKALTKNQNEPYLHFLLARAYAAQGDQKNSYRERGEYHYLRGNYQFAIEQFKRAFVFTSTEYERQSLGARIEEIENELNSIQRI